MDEEYPVGNIKLYPCSQCQRCFKQESLAKHMAGCKNITKQRKIFDSGRQRATDSDVIYTKTKNTLKVQIEATRAEGRSQQPDASKSNWREKHNEFLKNVRQARIISEAVKTGAPVPKFEPNAVPTDYVNCPFCLRNFNAGAAERHIPFCEIQTKRQKINNSANQKTNGGKSKFQTPPMVQRKQSSEQNFGGQHSNDGINGYGQAGISKGYSNISSGGNEGRRPIKYDHLYYESDNQDAGGAYAAKNKTQQAQNNSRQADQLLRTGRNMRNSELNALARNRSGNSSQKESPTNRRQQVTQQQQQQTGGAHRAGGAGGAGYASRVPQHSQNEITSGNSKFCHECGTEFPVHWAKYCSFCGGCRL